MQKDKPLVSIIMPSYNCGSYITEAINSIMNQTYQNWELIILDDGSSDNSVSLIKSYNDSRIRFLGSSQQLGAFGTRNKMFKKTRGQFVTFLDADDFMDAKRLELQLNAMNADQSLGMVGCQINYVDQQGNFIRRSSKPETYEEVKEKMLERNVIGGAIMFIRKEVLDTVGGGYRSYYGRLSYQDYDLSLLIAEKYPCYNLPEALYYYRQHSDSTSKIIHTDRILANEIVRYLAKQRREKGTDDLMDGNSHLVDQYFDQLRKPFVQDPSLVYRNYASTYMYSNLISQAIWAAWQAVRIRPNKFINWRTLQFCLRKFLIKKIQDAY